MPEENATQDVQNIETAQSGNVGSDPQQMELGAVKESAEGSAPEAAAEDEAQTTGNEGSDPEPESKAVQELKRVRRRAQDAERALQEQAKELAYLQGRYGTKENQQEPEAETYEEEIIRKAEQRFQAKLAKEREEAEAKKLEQSYSQRIKQATDQNPDLVDKISSLSQLPAHAETLSAIKASEQAPKIVEFLADNHDLVYKMASMSPYAAVKEIGKLEARFEKKPEPQNKQQKPVAQAPEPISPTSGRGNAKKVEDLSFNEYMAEMNKRDRESGRL